MAVRVQDRGANRLIAALAESGPREVRVGIMGDEAGEQKADSPLTVAQVAEYHEFGYGVPRRSWLRAYCDEREAVIRRRLRSIADAVVVRQQPLDPGLEQLGLLTVGEIQERISNRIAPPNAPATIAKKGSDVPLIDTGQLRSSITHLVTERGKA